MTAARTIRISNFILRILQLCVSVIVLGIFSYFLAVLADHNLAIQRWVKAVEGISGVAAFYAIVASIFTLSIGGIPFFAGVAMVLDFAFTAGFIAIAIMARDGTQTCTGHVDTPIGNGDANQPAGGYGSGGFGTGDGKQLIYMPSLKSACRLQKGVFAVSIIGIFLFLVSIIAQHLYMHHRETIKTSQSGGSRLRSLFRFRRHKVDPRSAIVDFNQANDGANGTIPLSDQPSTEKPPRSTKVFGRGVSNYSATDQVTEPQPTAQRDDTSGCYNSNTANMQGYNYSSPYPYSNSAYYYGIHGNPYSTDNPYRTEAWQDYDHGQSGIGDSRFAFGYGDMHAGRATY
ncbi:hypothetical protein CPC735_060740 [Coccidioides posadasii C735 delta SOWgp]|uniref:MARVEL domain-containing protein n=1 Tax=Coccidioides posadasii (strain C735) TaxID=222929 RepID=C5PFL5_COCP7|nr:hypothetical protein CPC735_060740 [Coccidioides posadasii C735 delta SOWgp]EER24704.1 hypothetical protein CPC735_060740 [Coccidioides posadasii C735 delta SOWgp]|eukprot:XP_003066849.1 hypothetical protein CPC735_060740 [Coccidioides posadasii C735 delta SOWgp]